MLFPGPANSSARQCDSDELRPPSEPATTILTRAWQSGHEPDLEHFVAGLTRAMPRELAALIQVDFHERWSRKIRQRPEEYLQRFPAVAADAELAVDVIYSEYLAREQAGEHPQPLEYQTRFPAFASVLTEQIRLHHALETLHDDDTPVDLGLADPLRTFSNHVLGVPSELEHRFEILELIGSGGMGVVYKARQPALNRFVALKMVRAIDASNPELLTRFRAEARVVAALHHPHIVQVHDYGQHDGLPYIAMELVEGGSLSDRLDGTPWPPRAAAALLVKLADAVQFAHERQVIHRDLKPANVLIVSGAAELEIKITDFGLAKCFSDASALHTRSNAFLGTPSYMAPEQANGRPCDIGPAADIYSLGAILYELVTGQPPLRGESPIETLRLLLSTEPVSLHRHSPWVPRDLATICDKCLHREMDRRYGSAAALRADLERYLDGKPIQARPIGKLERAWRWCGRNPLLASALACVATLLVGIAAISLWYSGQLREELTKTQLVEKSEHAANQTSQRRLWDAYISEALARNGSRQVGQRFAALDSIDKAIALKDTIGRSDDQIVQLRNAIMSSVVLPDMRTVRALQEWPSSGYAGDFSFAADHYVVAAEDGALSGFRLSSGQRLWTTAGPKGRVAPILSRNGRFLATVSQSGTTVWQIDGTEPKRLWEAATKFFSFAPDGEHAAYSHPTRGMWLVRVSDGVDVRQIGTGSSRSFFSFHARSGRIAVCGPTSIQVIAGDTGKIEVELPLGGSSEPRVVWHPSGEYLAVWGDAEGIKLWNVKTRSNSLGFRHHGMPAQLAFNADGSILISLSLWDRRLLVWDAGTGNRILEVPRFVSDACDIGPSRQLLFLTNLDNQRIVTELNAGECRTLPLALHVPLGYWHRASISPEGRIIAASSFYGLELWDLQSNRRLIAREVGPCLTLFDKAGQLYIGCQKGIFRLPRNVVTLELGNADIAADLSGRRTAIRFGPPEKLSGPIVPMSLSMNASGETLIVEDEQGWAVIRLNDDSQITRLSAKPDARTSTVSNDNRFAVTANWYAGGAEVWDGKSGSRLADLAVGIYGVVQFSPDGRLLAATPDGVTVWRTSDWRRIGQMRAKGTTPDGVGIGFSPDSRVLAVGQVNGTLSLFDPHTGKEWAHLTSRELSVASTIVFSPDQRWLFVASAHESAPAQIWDLVGMRRELADRGLDMPADVLRAGVKSTVIEDSVDILFDGGEMFDTPRSAETETLSPKLDESSR